MASDIFLKVDGIKGEATDVDHKDEIEVVSWSYARSDKRGIDGPATVRADESRDFQSRRHDISDDRDGASLLDAADVRGGPARGPPHKDGPNGEQTRTSRRRRPV